MAVIKVFNNIFEKDYKSFEYDTSKSLIEQIEEYTNTAIYSDYMVECYDPETDETFFAPLEENIEKPCVAIIANGKSVSADYKVQENDVICVSFLPLSSDKWSWGGAAIGSVASSILYGIYGAVVGGWAGFAVGAIVGGVLGFVAGGFIGTMFKPQDIASIDYGDKGKKQPDVRGAENQSLLNQNFPFVIGKHLITPFIVGDPYTEYVGERGEDAYIRLCYCAGYAPLKLTEFKLGDFVLAYNKSQGIARPTLISGLLKGYSTGGTPDNGDILDYWKNNDIELELLQQSPNSEINYGGIYPSKKVEQEINANCLFVADKSLADQAKVVYKGTEFPSNFRTNNVYFTESCPKKFTINLDFPNGLYATYNETSDSSSKTKYASIPLWFAIQYRIQSRVNNSSDSSGADYSVQSKTETSSDMSWKPITVFNGKDYGAVYTKDLSLADYAAHKGNDFGDPVEYKDYVVKEYYKESELIQKIIESASKNDTYFGMYSPSVYYYNNNHSAVSANMYGYGQIDIKPVNGYSSVITAELDRDHMRGKVIVDTDGILYLTYSEGSYINNEKSSNLITYNIPRTKVTFYRCDGLPNTVRGTREIWIDRIVTNGKFYYSVESDTLKNFNKYEYAGNWINKLICNFQSLSGEDGLSQTRLSATVELSDEEMQAVLEPDCTTKSIEVRVIRVSPCYLNETKSSGDIGAYSYSDTMTVSTIVTECFDEGEYHKSGNFVPVRVGNSADMNKFVYISLKAKADASGYIAQQLKRFNCTAESFSPYWNSIEKQFYPALKNSSGNTNIKRVSKYYGYYDKDNNPINRRNSDCFQKEISKEQYEEARGNGYNWVEEKTGSNYTEIIKKIVFEKLVYSTDGSHFFIDKAMQFPVEIRGTTSRTENENEYKVYGSIIKNGVEACFLNDNAAQYNNNSVASGFLLACLGAQSGPVSMGYDNIDMLSIQEWAESTIDVTDGSTYAYDTAEHEKGEIVKVSFTANGYIYQGQKLEDIIKKICIAGRAVYTYDDTGKLKVIMDKPVEYSKGVITAQTVISTNNTYNYEPLPAGLRISFNDENDGYEQNGLYCWNDGYDLQNYHGNVEPYSLDLVTNPYQAHSLGRYYLACKNLNREVLNKKIGLEGKSYSLGDVVLVNGNDLLIGEGSGRIQELIEVDDKIYGFVTDSTYDYTGEVDDQDESTQGVMVMQPKKTGKKRIVTLRLSKSSIIYIYNDALITEEEYQNLTDTEKKDVSVYELKPGTTNVVIFDTPVDRDNSPDPNGIGTYKLSVGDIVMFGLINKISEKYRIIKIKPEKDGTFTEILIPYTEELYNYGVAIPAFQTNMTLSEPMIDPISLNEVPQTINNLNTQYNNILNKAVEMAGSTPPTTVPIINNVVFTKDSIILEANVVSDKVEDRPENYEWIITRHDGTEQVVKTGSRKYASLFEGDYNHLEKEQLDEWTFKVRFCNSYGLYSEYSTSRKGVYSESNYTWIPSTPTVSDIIATKDGFSVNWSYTRNLGESKFCIIVNKGDTEIFKVTDLTGNRFVYNFNRAKSKDWYPEVSDLQDYTVTVKHYNEVYGYDDTTGKTDKNIDTSQYYTWKPSKPTIVTSPLVTKDGFTVEWNYTESYDIGEGKFVVEVTDGNGLLRTSEVVVGNSYNYIFNRSTDGYPEATKVNDNRSLADYSVTVKHYNDKYGLEDAAVSEVAKLNTTLYKTWIPSKPTVTTSAVDKDGFTINWSAEEIYDLGEAKYKVEVYYRNDDDTATKLFTKDNISNNQLQYNFVRSVDGYPEKEPVTIGDKNVLGLNRYYVKVYHSNNVYSMSDATVSENASLNTSEYGTWIPSKPNVKDIIARKDGFVINWGYASNYGDNNFEVTVGKVVDDVFTPIQPTVKIEGYSYNYTFNRELDKYPEIEDLEKYLVKVQCNNEVYKDLDQAKTEKTVDTDGYGTWRLGAFGQNNINIDVMDRTVLMTLSTASMPNIEYYGETKYEISIKRIGITKASVEDVVPDEQDYPYPVIEPDENFYKPNLYGSPLSNELDYRTDEVDGYITSNYKYSQTLPLVGQETKNISNTRYRYKIRAVNEAGYETDYQEVEITALCTSIRDIVKANENYKNLYVTKLSALNANVGLISQGGFGSFSSWSNFWALSSMTAEDAGTDRDIKRGAFRVGDNNQYIAVVPPHSSFGEGESLITNDGDYYKVVINAGNITLATDETSFDGGTYVYDKDDSSKRMKLSSSGLEMQLYNPVTNNYETKATFNADTKGNLTISNSAADSDELPKNGIKVDEDSVIYHLENDTKDTNGGNAGNFTFIPNTDNPFSESNLIKGKNKAYDGTISKTSKAEDICVFTNSDSILIGEHRVDIKDSSMSVDGELKYWNELFGKTFIWEK